jgi:uncharacterized protein YciI
MPQLFAVTRSFGPGWNPSLPLEQQQDWRVHADFMNALKAEGFVLLGGPLVGTSEVLLIIRAGDEEAIRARLAGDCWAVKDLLRTTRILLWNLRLGSLP